MNSYNLTCDTKVSTEILNSIASEELGVIEICVITSLLLEDKYSEVESYLVKKSLNKIVEFMEKSESELTTGEKELLERLKKCFENNQFPPLSDLRGFLKVGNSENYCLAFRNCMSKYWESGQKIPALPLGDIIDSIVQFMASENKTLEEIVSYFKTEEEKCYQEYGALEFGKRFKGYLVEVLTEKYLVIRKMNGNKLLGVEITPENIEGCIKEYMYRIVRYNYEGTPYEKELSITWDELYKALENSASLNRQISEQVESGLDYLKKGKDFYLLGIGSTACAIQGVVEQEIIQSPEIHPKSWVDKWFERPIPKSSKEFFFEKFFEVKSNRNFLERSYLYFSPEKVFHETHHLHDEFLKAIAYTGLSNFDREDYQKWTSEEREEAELDLLLRKVMYEVSECNGAIDNIGPDDHFRNMTILGKDKISRKKYEIVLTDFKKNDRDNTGIYYVIHTLTEYEIKHFDPMCYHKYIDKEGIPLILNSIPECKKIIKWLKENEIPLTKGRFDGYEWKIIEIEVASKIIKG